MPHWRGRAALQVGDAADVGRHDHLGGGRAKGLAQVTELAVAQLVGQLGVQHRVGTGRATAQVRLAAGELDLKAQSTQVLLHPAAQLLAVLQRAGRVEGHGLRHGLDAAFQLRAELGQPFAQVLGERTDARSFGRVSRVVCQQVAVVFDRDATAGGVHQDGFHPGLTILPLQVGPPSVDGGTHLRLAAVLVVQVKLDCAAATGLGRHHGLHANGIEHAGGGAVDVGAHGRLHATGQQQHLARVAAAGPTATGLRRRHLGLERGGQQGAHQLPQLHGGPKQWRGQALLQGPAQRTLGRRARHLGIDKFAPDVHQVAVVHARGAGAFAVAAGQAAVQVQLRLARRSLAFKHLFHQVDAPARPVELVAQQLVGRAGGVAKAAVHALAQDGFGGQAVCGVFEFGREFGVHGELRRARSARARVAPD